MRQTLHGPTSQVLIRGPTCEGGDEVSDRKAWSCEAGEGGRGRDTALPGPPGRFSAGLKESPQGLGGLGLEEDASQGSRRLSGVICMCRRLESREAQQSQVVQKPRSRCWPVQAGVTIRQLTASQGRVGGLPGCQGDANGSTPCNLALLPARPWTP